MVTKGIQILNFTKMIARTVHKHDPTTVINKTYFSRYVV